MTKISKIYLEELFEDFSTYVANQPEEDLPMYQDIAQKVIVALTHYDELSIEGIRVVALYMKSAMCDTEDDILRCLEEIIEIEEGRE